MKDVQEFYKIDGQDKIHSTKRDKKWEQVKEIWSSIVGDLTATIIIYSRHHSSSRESSIKKDTLASRHPLCSGEKGKQHRLQTTSQRIF
jgi:hypothetical protein